MNARRLIAWGGLLFASLLATGSGVHAIELNGAWATDANNCPKVFERKGTQLGFTDMSDAFGGGFIVEGDQIVGKFARCRIKARKDSGPNVNLIASCATLWVWQARIRAWLPRPPCPPREPPPALRSLPKMGEVCLRRTAHFARSARFRVVRTAYA